MSRATPAGADRRGPLPVIETAPGGGGGTAGTACTDGCITCGDLAVEVVIERMLPDAMAVVATTGGAEAVSVALVDARSGDTILVHAGEAIAVIGGNHVQ